MEKYKLYELNEIEKTTLESINVPVEVYQVVAGQLLIVFFNSEILKFYNSTYEEMVILYDSYIYRYIHPEDRQRLKDSTNYAIENDQEGYECTYRSLNRNTGKYYFINEKATIVKKKDGVKLLYVTYINPNQFAELFNSDDDMILHSNKQSDFQNFILSRLSHNMRTPMNAIVNLSDFGMAEAENESAKTYFKDIKSSSEYLLGLLNDMLDLNTIETKKIELKPSIIDCNDNLNDILNVTKAKAANKDIKLVYLNKGCAPKYLFVDKLRLNQIIVNILNNAIKYTPEFGKVFFKIEFKEINEDEVIATITVLDNGIGMSKDFKEKIFTPFARENNKLMSSGDGSGLGISIVKNLIDIFGGSILIKSKYGRGTLVQITLPLIKISKEEYDEKNSLHLESNNLQKLKGKRILIVDDNEINLRILEKILVNSECKVECARNGLDAYECYVRNEVDYFDAILMDVKMPLMDGYSSTKKIREVNKSIPIIMLSANAYNEDVTLSLSKGANAHLSKPIDKRKLLSTLEFFII